MKLLNSHSEKVRVTIMDLSSLQVSRILKEPHLIGHINRINASIESDPSLAIGSTKELIESVLKDILNEFDIEWDKNDSLPKLFKETQKALELVPNKINSSKKGSDSIQRVLRGLSDIVNGIAELRNLYGTGHGRDQNFQGLNPRHARLVVSSGMAMCEFLLEVCEYKEHLKLSQISGFNWKLRNTLSQSYGTRTIAFHPNQDVIAVGGTDHQISLYSLDTGNLISQHTRYYQDELSGDVNSLTFSHNGELIISTGYTSSSRGFGQKKIQVLNWKRGEVITSLPPREGGDSENSIALHPARNIIAFESYGDVIIYNLDLENHIKTLKEQDTRKSSKDRFKDQINHLVFGSDGKYLVSSSQSGKVTIWDWERGVVLHHRIFDWPIYATAINHKGNTLAIGGECNDIILLDLDNEKENRLEGHSKAIYCLHFSNDAKFLASASRDGTAKVFYTKTRSLLRDFRLGSGLDCWGNPIAIFSPDGQNLILHSTNREIEVWTKGAEL